MMIEPRIIWLGPSLFVESGYGRMSFESCIRLKAKGLDIMSVGGQHEGGIIEVADVRNLPRYRHPYFADVIQDYANKYNRNLAISVFDAWAMGHLAKIDIPVVHWIPVDTWLDPIGIEPMAEVLNSAAEIWTYTHFGVEEFHKVGIDYVKYLPPGLRTDTFRPLPADIKPKAKKLFGIPEDAFVFGFNGANRSERKDIPALLEVFSWFLKKTKANAYLLLWTNTDKEAGTSYDIDNLSRQFGVKERLRVPIEDNRLNPLPDDKMNLLYNAMDVYVTASRGEGFGMPVVEAMAAGIPIIAHNCSSHTELLGDGEWGWLVKSSTTEVPLWTQMHLRYPLVDKIDLLQKMMESYEDEKKRKEFGEKGHQFAQQFDWENVVNTMQQYIDDLEDYIVNGNREGVNPQLLSLIPKSVDPPRVLDAGAGLRTPYKKHLSHLGEYVAMDIRAGRKIDIVGDIQEIPFPDNHFGFAWCTEVLEHLQNPELAYKELRRVARHGVIAYPTPESENFSRDKEYREVHFAVDDAVQRVTREGEGLVIW